MGKYYSSDWLQTRSMGIFVSAGLHLVLLGIILPKLSGEELLLRGKLKFRNIPLISLTSEQQQRLPETLQPPNSNVIPPEEIETILDSTPVFTNNLPPAVESTTEAIPIPPPLDIPPPPPPPVESLVPPTEPVARLLPVTPPPIPRELIEIINPREDSFNSPKVTEPMMIIPEPEIATQPETTPVERENDLIASVQAKAESLKYDPSNTTIGERQANYQSWISWQTDNNPQTIAIQGEYPPDGCIKKIEGETVYGVLVNPTGEIVNLHLIQSAGYSLLNTQAAQQIESYNFSPSVAIQPYLITVKFAYNPDLCPSLSL